MAKETVKPTAATAAIAPRPSPVGNGEIVDTRTGEVASLSTGAADDLMDAQALAIMSSGDILAKLKAVKAAKAEDFSETLEADFWKPKAEGDEIRGVYVGSAKAGRILQHGLAQEGKNGQPFVIRMNGGHSLTAQFKQVKPGEPVRVQYKGKVTTKGVANESGAGRDMGDWVVTKLKTA